MRDDKFNMISLNAYKFSAALFCFFGLFLGELGLYLNPIFGPAKNLPSNIVAMLFIVSFFVYGWRAFFVGKFGYDWYALRSNTYKYKGSIVAYVSIIIFFFCGFTLFLSIFTLHNKLLFVSDFGYIFYTYFLIRNVKKIKKEVNKDTDFFKIYFSK